MLFMGDFFFVGQVFTDVNVLQFIVFNDLSKGENSCGITNLYDVCFCSRQQHMDGEQQRLMMPLSRRAVVDRERTGRDELSSTQNGALYCSTRCVGAEGERLLVTSDVMTKN
jgi:hypothetical protein